MGGVQVAFHLVCLNIFIAPEIDSVRGQSLIPSIMDTYHRPEILPPRLAKAGII